jgi:hypothetical protein
MRHNAIFMRGVFMAACVIFISCAKKGSDDNSGQKAVQYAKTDRFKAWAKDTLDEFLTRSAADTTIFENSFTSGTHTIGAFKDTLALFVENRYALQVDPASYGEYDGSVTHSVISLLKEYGELPDTVFELTFIEYVFYSPSSAEQQVYDYAMEIKDLEVNIAARGLKIAYRYNRGSLSSSKETKDIKPCNGCLSSYMERNYDFIYLDEVGSVEKKLNNAKRFDIKKAG